MAQLHESSARSTPEEDMVLPLTPGYGQLDPLSACAVEDWVRRGNCLPVENVPVASIRNSYTPRQEQGQRATYPDTGAITVAVTADRDPSNLDAGDRRRASASGNRTPRRQHHAARLFEGNDAEAFALAVHLNVTHGLPLTLSERKGRSAKSFAVLPALVRSVYWVDRRSIQQNSRQITRVCNRGNLPVGSPAWARRKGPPGESGSRTATCCRILVDESPCIAARDSAQSGRLGHHRTRRAPAHRQGRKSATGHSRQKLGTAAPRDRAMRRRTVVEPLLVGTRVSPDGRGSDLLQRLRKIRRSDLPSGDERCCDCCPSSRSRSAPAMSSPKPLRSTARAPSPR